MPIAQFSGLASGIDSAALIDAIIKARETKNQIVQNRIDALNSENDALGELNTKLLKLKDLLEDFRSINDGGISKKGSSSNSSVATAVVGSGAVNGTYSLSVSSVASAATASFNDSYSSSTDLFAPNADGTVTIGVDIGTGGDLVSVDIDITNETTLEDFVEAFNSDSNASGRASASIVNVGTSASPDYRVMITSLQSGTEQGTLAFDIPDTTSFGGQSDLQNRTVSQAVDSVFSLSGISGDITRSSNYVSDLITGVSFQLLQDGDADLTVSNDADATVDKINEIVEAYNDIVSYIEENDTVTRKESDTSTTNIFGSLAKTRVDNDFLQQFRLDLASATSSNGTTVLSFADFGISTKRDGTLEVDEDALRAAIAADPTGVTEVLQDFADTTAGVSGTIASYTRFNGTIDLAEQANETEIEVLQDTLEQYDRANDKLRERLELQFARLEGISSNLQSAQNSLSSLLSTL